MPSDLSLWRAEYRCLRMRTTNRFSRWKEPNFQPIFCQLDIRVAFLGCMSSDWVWRSCNRTDGSDRRARTDSTGASLCSMWTPCSWKPMPPMSPSRRVLVNMLSIQITKRCITWSIENSFLPVTIEMAVSRRGDTHSKLAISPTAWLTAKGWPNPIFKLLSWPLVSVILQSLTSRIGPQMPV